jgi:hypothetical protein
MQLFGTATSYSARAAWDYGILTDCLRTRLGQAIIRGKAEISLVWTPLDGAATSTELKRTTGSNFIGRSVWAAGTPKELVSAVEAILYSNDSGHVLVGQEKWSNGDVDWFIVQFSKEMS